jgi:hypothetical protein
MSDGHRQSTTEPQHLRKEPRLMSTATEPREIETSVAHELRGANDRMRLRRNVFGATVVLLIQYALGISANLYATLPASDRHKSPFSAFATAVSNGPAVVAAHALVGTLLLVAAVSAFVRGLRSGRPPIAVLTGVALAAVLIAWLSGASFVGHMNNGASFTMALAAGVAILSYVIILLIA